MAQVKAVHKKQQLLMVEEIASYQMLVILATLVFDLNLD